VHITNTLFREVHIEHCVFDKETVFDHCVFEDKFTAALNCKGLRDAAVVNCTLSTGASSTFRLHQKEVEPITIDRPHIDDVTHHILGQFQIGQTGFRSKRFEDVLHEAKKVSVIGEDVLEELIKRGVLKEEKAGTRRSLEVAEKGAVSAFLQQSILKGRMVETIERLAKRHIIKKK
jgi:hypothetical protein